MYYCVKGCQVWETKWTQDNGQAIYKRNDSGAGNMAQWVRALAALPEDLGDKRRTWLFHSAVEKLVL